MPNLTPPGQPLGREGTPVLNVRLIRRRVALVVGAAACVSVLTSCAHAGGAPTASGSAAAPTRAGVSQVRIDLTSNGTDACTLSRAVAKAGPVTFTIADRSSTAITEVELQSDDRILGEKENLAPGLAPVSFTVTLGGGKYQVYCPGAAKETRTLTVTGKAAAQPSGDVAAELTSGTKGYAAYVDGVVDAMVQAVGTLKSDIDAGDLAAAQQQYPRARPYYERIESDVDGFVLPGHKITDNAGSLDYLLDMRASNLDPKVGWHGFHAIERDLFARRRITAGTRSLAAELQKNVGILDTTVRTLTYKPEDLANGAADLLEEVQTTKITGEEEQYSHIDIVDFAGNVEGAQQAFAFLEPGLKTIDPTLTSEVSAQFAAVNAKLDGLRSSTRPGGYFDYTASVKAADGAILSHAVQGLQAPLSQIAAKVATAQ